MMVIEPSSSVRVTRRQRGLQGWGTRLAEWRYGRRRGRFHGHGCCGQRRSALEQFAAIEGLFAEKGQWSCHGFLPMFFCWEGNHLPAIGHKTGGWWRSNRR